MPCIGDEENLLCFLSYDHTNEKLDEHQDAMLAKHAPDTSQFALVLALWNTLNPCFFSPFQSSGWGTKKDVPNFLFATKMVFKPMNSWSDSCFIPKASSAQRPCAEARASFVSRQELSLARR